MSLCGSYWLIMRATP